jgi:archaellum component FlaC
MNHKKKMAYRRQTPPAEPTHEERIRTLEARVRMLSMAFDGLAERWETFKEQIEEDITFLEEEKIDPLIEQNT